MSRMDRYYKSDSTLSKRSRLNQDLYRSIYDTDEYTNIEGIATMDKTNEIDLSKLRSMLKSRDDFNSQKEYRQLFKKDEVEIKKEESDETEEENFDIRDILEKVKSQKQEDEKYRSVDNTNYNLLKELKIQERKKEIEENKQELKELVDTLTSTSVLSKMGDSELSLSMFDDLKASEETMSNSKSIQKILDEVKQEKDEQKMSNSFYTKSLNFSKKDLDDYENSKEEKRRRLKIKLVVSIIVFISILLVVFMLYKFIF